MNPRLQAVIDRAEKLPDADQEALAAVIEAELEEREWEALTKRPGARAFYDQLRAELRRRGFKSGVVTDSVSPTAEKLRWFRSRGLALAWDAFANSCEVGVRKPHLRIYQAALEQCGVSPAEALFVGHKASELDGARAVGMLTAAVYRDADAIAEYPLDAFTGLLSLSVLSGAGDV